MGTYVWTLFPLGIKKSQAVSEKELNSLTLQNLKEFMTFEQTCPLCDNAAANYKITHTPFGKSFECPTCNRFFIDSSSENYLSSLPEVTKTERRAQLSKKAKACLDDDVFVIREPQSTELGGDGHGVARSAMISEYWKRDRDDV